MADGTATQRQQGRRRIIERPRLTRLLDESPARIKMLVAPAGYGKTTLARQWIDQREASAWYRTSPAATDVAVLASAIGSVTARIIPDCNSPLEERLRVTKVPNADGEALAGLLIEELRSWPLDAWLVIDDAHYITESPASLFIESLVRDAPLNVLLSARQRPDWIAPRDLLYGDVMEMGRNTLAMTREEAADVLGDATASSGVVALADGWPAVVGLVSLTADPTRLFDRRSELPESLYAFLAEELYQELPRALRDVLGLVAVAEIRSHEVILELFEDADGAAMVQQAVETGWLTETETTLELHPLLASFLRQKSDATLVHVFRQDAIRSVDILLRRHYWDEAFAIIENYKIPEALPALLRAGMDHLLPAGQLTSVGNWLRYGEREKLVMPEAVLVSAELSFRQGSFYESELLGRQAAEGLTPDDDWISRAYSIAGRAAHAANREQEAVGHYRMARKAAHTARDIYVATLGELSAAIDLELDEAPHLLERIKPDGDDVERLVIYFGRWLSLHTRFGTFGSLEEPRRVYRLLHRLTDPIQRCSFRNTYGYAVASSGDVEEARLVISDQLDDAKKYRLDFVIPYTRLINAVTEMISGNIENASREVDAVEEAARSTGDDLLAGNAIAIRTRCLITQGRFALAIRESLRWRGAATPSLNGEILASRAVALACTGEYARALKTAEVALSTTKAIEARCMSFAARAIVATLRADVDMYEFAREAMNTAIAQHCIEVFAAAYRGCAQLAVLLLRSDATREDFLQILSMTNDTGAFAEAMETRPGDSWEALSSREQEVLLLVADGHSNRQIGDMLYIAEATVKVHVRHIFEKLDVTSRTTAALKVPHHARSKLRHVQEQQAAERP